MVFVIYSQYNGTLEKEKEMENQNEKATTDLEETREEEENMLEWLLDPDTSIAEIIFCLD